MAELAGRLATASTLPIMLDSTEPEVLRAGLERLGGRSIVNSVNYEDGDGPGSRFQRTMALVRRARRRGRRAVHRRGGPGPHRRVEGPDRRPADPRPHRRTTACTVEDIVVDTLTFPITTGQEEVRRDALETIEAIRELKRRHPDVQTTLGISNVSFGLNPAARQVLNSVFLHECVNAGLDTAIVSRGEDPADGQDPRRAALGRAGPRLRPPPRGLRPAQPVHGAVRGRHRRVAAKAGRAEELAALPLFERLERRIVDGERNGLEADLDAALESAARPGDHQRHAAVGHEDRRRAVRLRADAAAVRAAVAPR